MLKNFVLCVIIAFFSILTVEVKSEPLVYDCFPFFNELDVLEIRLNVLDEVVDKFVIVEMSKTHTGMDKPFYFEQNKERFKKFWHKIIHIKVDDVPSTENLDKVNAAWLLENYQRDQIMLGLKDAKDSDIVLISDCDEIPNPVRIKEYKQNRESGIRVFKQSIYYFFLNNFCKTIKKWRGTRMGRLSDLKNPNQNLDTTDSYLKHSKKGLPTYFRFCGGLNLYSGGWHFTFCGGIETLKQKIKSVSEADEYENEEVNEEYVKNIISKGKWRKHSFRIVPIDEQFPKYLRENQEKYKDLILEVPQYSVFHEFKEFCKDIFWELKKNLLYLFASFSLTCGNFGYSFLKSHEVGCSPGESMLVP